MLEMICPELMWLNAEVIRVCTRPLLMLSTEIWKHKEWRLEKGVSETASFTEKHMPSLYNNKKATLTNFTCDHSAGDETLDN